MGSNIMNNKEVSFAYIWPSLPALQAAHYRGVKHKKSGVTDEF